MIVLIDGKEVEVKNDIKIITEHDELQLHVTVNHEGLTYDVLDVNDNLNVLETGYDFYIDILDRLFPVDY